MYKIILRWVTPFPWDKEEMVIDHAEDVGHARYLVKQYQFIYGRSWNVRYEC